jgi:hypothetical protein
VAAAAAKDPKYQETAKALCSGTGAGSAIPAAIQRAKVNPAQCRVTSDEVVFVEHRCWVPKDDNLRRRIVQSLHSTPAAGHPGIAGTLDLVRRHFYWPKMSAYIRRLITHYRLCRTKRSLTQAP